MLSLSAFTERSTSSDASSASAAFVLVATACSCEALAEELMPFENSSDGNTGVPLVPLPKKTPEKIKDPKSN